MKTGKKIVWGMGLMVVLISGCAPGGYYVNQNTGETATYLNFPQCRFPWMYDPFLLQDDTLDPSDSAWADRVVWERQCKERMAAREGWRWVPAPQE